MFSFPHYISVCSAMPHKTWTMRFRVPPNIFTQKEKPPYRRFSFWWRRRNPKLRFVRCFATFRIICPFCSAVPYKTWTMRFQVPPNIFTQKENRHIGGFLFGGDGGTRNRVRKSLPVTFYERIRYINIPSVKSLTTGV